MNFHRITLLTFYLTLSWIRSGLGVNITEEVTESTLEKLVKIFSKPGAFHRVDEILGENLIEESSCPVGDDGLDCRRAAARRSVDCPTGDCYCFNCADAGPDSWPTCCQDHAKCCSHLAAACRNCDHPVLIPFCSKNFKKCSGQIYNITTKYETRATHD